MRPDDLERLAGLAHRLADAAAAETLPRFRSLALDTDDKDTGTGFDPVTEADRRAERAIRKILSDERPDDGVFGEEQARTHGISGLTWVIDPIDGTRSYISGLPTWGTLIALDDGTRGRIGVIDQPHIGERVTGILSDTPAAALDFRGKTVPIRTRTGRDLAGATLFTTDPALFQGTDRARFDAVSAQARLTRYGCDCYAYALLAMGHVDLVIEAGLHAYDIAAPKVVIEAAGGIVTDWQGGDCRWGGRVLAAATPELHAEALAILSRR